MNEFNIITVDETEIDETEIEYLDDEIENPAELTKKLAAVASGEKELNDWVHHQPQKTNSNTNTTQTEEEAHLLEEHLIIPSNSKAENPLIRIIVALLVFSGLGILVFGVFSLGSSILNGNKKDSDSSTVAKKDDSTSETSPTEKEDRLRAELALIEQDSQPIPTPQPETQPQPQSRPQPETKPAPPPATQSRPQPKPIPTPQPRPTPTPQPVSQVQPQIDPFERWNQLSMMGVTASNHSSTSSDSHPAPIVEEKNTNNSNSNQFIPASTTQIPQTAQNEQLNTSTFSSNSNQSLVASSNLSTVTLGENTSSDYSNSDSKPDNFPSSTMRNYVLGNYAAAPPPAQLASSSSTTNNSYTNTANQVIPIGSTANATVITDIIGSPLQNVPTRSTITLSEPLLDQNGEIALDAGSNLIVEVSQILDNGLTTLRVIAISYYDSHHQLQQKELPPDALIITGHNRSPLIARNLNDAGGSNLGQDVLIGLLGAGSKGLEILNLPDEEIVEESSSYFGNYRRRSTTGDRSLGQGALEGAFDVTQERLEERSDRILQERASQPPVYLIPAQTEVSVYVNSFFEVQN